MAVLDHLHAEDEKARRRQERAARKVEEQLAKIDTMLSWTFEKAAKRERDIARALTNDGIFSVALEQARPVHNVKDFFISCADIFRYPTAVYNLPNEYIEQNNAFIKFQAQLAQEGLETKVLSAETRYAARSVYTLISMKIQTSEQALLNSDALMLTGNQLEQAFIALESREPVQQKPAP